MIYKREKLIYESTNKDKNANQSSIFENVTFLNEIGVGGAIALGVLSFPLVVLAGVNIGLEISYRNREHSIISFFSLNIAVNLYFLL